jgi:hypothetical protein
VQIDDHLDIKEIMLKIILQVAATDIIFTVSMSSVLATTYDDHNVMPCAYQRDAAYDCLVTTPHITPIEIPNCLSCITHWSKENKISTRTTCSEVPASTFCQDTVECVAKNCAKSCIPYVGAAYECILMDLESKTGCDVCPFEDFLEIA